MGIFAIVVVVVDIAVGSKIDLLGNSQKGNTLN